MALPIVAVVGRPNVGKSTLINRIAQVQDAIVHAQPGVTRDRSYHRADWNGREFILVDTGGIEFTAEDTFGDSIRSQALVAAEEADVVVFLVDGRTGPQRADEEVARVLQKSRKPVFLLVNKLDTPASEEGIHEFWALGLGDPRAVSALHGHNTGDVLDDLVEALPPEVVAEEAGPEVRVAIIGKPNAGKSSLFNKLARAERTIVSDVPGTTRDAVDTLVEHEGTSYRLIDTAGLRRKSRIDETVEYYSFVRAMRAIDRADVSILVVDSAEGVTDQDQRVAAFAEERGCALVIALNKWDLVEEDDRFEVEAVAHEQLQFVSYAPMLKLSALTGKGVTNIFKALDKAFAAYTQQVSTSSLNRFLADIRATGHTVSKQNRHLRLQYVTQTRQKPPGFVFFANHPKLVDENYKRYLENRLRENFDFTGTPIILKFKQKD